jgi:quercetin dioxygenase-like cupin family protein
MSDDDDMTAALLAAGALSPEEHALAQERMSRDSVFAAKAREWETALAPLAVLAPPAAPPADLLERIEERIDARRRKKMASLTLRDGEGEWIAMAPGIRMKILHQNLELRRQTILLEAEPGAVYPPHDHPQDEECYMISGDLVIGDEVLHAGDYQVAPAGSRHPMLTTRTGCRCILILAM